MLSGGTFHSIIDRTMMIEVIDKLDKVVARRDFVQRVSLVVIQQEFKIILVWVDMVIMVDWYVPRFCVYIVLVDPRLARLVMVYIVDLSVMEDLLTLLIFVSEVQVFVFLFCD